MLLNYIRFNNDLKPNFVQVVVLFILFVHNSFEFPNPIVFNLISGGYDLNGY